MIGDPGASVWVVLLVLEAIMATATGTLQLASSQQSLGRNAGKEASAQIQWPSNQSSTLLRFGLQSPLETRRVAGA